MIAGASGIDAALLVVSADDGPMPQTREHVRILAHLGIDQVVVVISRTDLAEPILVELAAESTVALLESYGLESTGPPILTSVRTGSGLADVRAELNGVRPGPRHPWSDRAWLPVDRVFRIAGAGTVVTGTLTQGSIDPGDRVWLSDDDDPVTVRRVEVTGQGVKRAIAGQRVALNLATVSTRPVRRGSVISDRPVSTTRFVDVWIQPDQTILGKPVSAAIVRIHHGARADAATIRSFTSGGLDSSAGAGLAQIRFQDAVPVLPGGRFVVRRTSPPETVAGGRFLDTAPDRPGAGGRPRIDELRGLARDDASLRLARRLHAGPTSRSAAVANLPANACSILKNWEQDGSAVVIDRPGSTACAVVSRERHATMSVISKRASPVETLTFPAPAFADAGARFLDHLRRSSGPTRAADWTIDPRVVDYLERSSLLVRFSDRISHGAWFEDAASQMLSMLASAGTVATGAVRDRLGISRDLTTALLEHCDELGLTKRTAEGRQAGIAAAEWTSAQPARRERRTGGQLEMERSASINNQVATWIPTGSDLLVVASSRSEADRSIGWSLAQWRAKGIAISYHLTSDALIGLPGNREDGSPGSETVVLPLSMADPATMGNPAGPVREDATGLVRVAWYEDLPTSMHEATRHRALGRLIEGGVRLEPRLGPAIPQPAALHASRAGNLQPDEREALGGAIGVPSDPATIGEAICGYHRSAGGTIAAERYWLPIDVRLRDARAE